MEHLIQFGVTIDDDKIEKMVMEKASQQCMKQINESIKGFTKSPYYCDSELKKMFKEEVKKVIDENKETIIAEVIKTVSYNLTRTKAIINAKTEIIDSVGVK